MAAKIISAVNPASIGQAGCWGLAGGGGSVGVGGGVAVGGGVWLDWAALQANKTANAVRAAMSTFRAIKANSWRFMDEGWPLRRMVTAHCIEIGAVRLLAERLGVYEPLVGAGRAAPNAGTFSEMRRLRGLRRLKSAAKARSMALSRV